MKITKREVLASVSIIAILFFVGLLISEKIFDWQTQKNEIYNKAVKIESSDLFDYGMRTNIGDAFVYGDLRAVDAVAYPEITGKYMYVEKIKERYTMHTRTVTTRVNGKTQTRTETYWTWDRIGKEELICKKIEFCGIIFPVEKIKIPDTEYIDTIKESSHIRYKYYGTAAEQKGTLFADLRDNTILDNSAFYKDMIISNTVDYLTTEIWVYLFCAAWMILGGICIYGFLYLENNWLE